MNVRVLLVVGLLVTGAAVRAAPAPVPYHNNPAAAATVTVNGIKLYYEQYGSGTPLLVIHGNSSDLSAMAPQIDYFSRSHRVIAPDTRGHGRSELGPGRLTYVQQADDLAALLLQLHVGPARVIGWSDGGIIGLLLALRHPEQVTLVAVTGANIFPEGMTADALAGTIKDNDHAAAMLAQGDTTQPWALVRQRMDLMVTQPDIKPAELESIPVPVLVMAGDHDIIRPEHTLLIYEHLRFGQLAIFPDSQHSVSLDRPELFNRTVEHFFAEATAKNPRPAPATDAK